MPRLGAKYTVSGYLDEIARRSFLTTTDDGVLNLKPFLEQLRSDWDISDFVTLFEKHLLPFGWSYKVDNGRSALGQHAQIQVFLPSPLQIVHVGRTGSPVWSEKALTAHCWSIKVRKRKAKLDVIPTSLYVSEHALRRIYERSGGCSYDDFPQMAAGIFQDILEKADTLLRERIFVQSDGGKYAIAVPTSGGVVVVNFDVVHTNARDPNLGMLITIGGKSFSRGVGSFNPSDFWNLQNADEPDGKNVPSLLVRTYYGDEDISERRTMSCILLDKLLSSVEPSLISPSNLLAAAKSPAGRRVLPDADDLVPQGTLGLRSDVIDSLQWLNAEDNGVMVLFRYEKTDENIKKVIAEIDIINATNEDV